MHNILTELIKRFNELYVLVQEEKRIIIAENIDELNMILEKKAKLMAEIDNIRDKSDCSKFLSNEGQGKELYNLMVSLQNLEKENVALMQQELDKLRKEKSDTQTTSKILKNYVQAGFQRQDIPKFFDKKK